MTRILSFCSLSLSVATDSHDNILIDSIIDLLQNALNWSCVLDCLLISLARPLLWTAGFALAADRQAGRQIAR